MAALAAVLSGLAMKTKHYSFKAAGRVPPTVGWKIAQHSHADHNELIIVLTGTIRTEIRSRVLAGQKGDMLLYPRGLPHREQAVGPEPLETIYIAWNESPSLPVAAWPLMSFDHENRVEYLARWMLDIHPAHSNEDRDLLDSLLNAALCKYAHPAPSSMSEMVMRTKRHILANVNKPITLDDLAAASGFSKFHFSRLFRQASGMTPMEFLRRMRMEVARTLLAGTPLPLKAIAPQVGLANEYHLSRTFKKVFGVVPTSLRK